VAGKSTLEVTSAAGQDLRITNVTKRFGDFVAVDDVSITVPGGSFFALLGPSGCGKTTTLRMVAGLEAPTAGSIVIGDTDVTWAKPYQRPVNTVFQSYALFPHLDIYENVAFGLRRKGRKDVKADVEAVLELTELTSMARRKPTQLSGGQQQRVALARAIVNRPAVLLLDEPLGALDLKLRRQMQFELKRIQTEVGLTFIHVTHDQEEAMTMADTIAVMNQGKVEQLGPPADLYENPRTTFVANFLGRSNFFPAVVTGKTGEDLTVDVFGARLTVPSSRVHATGSAVHLGVRPEKLRISPLADGVAAQGNRIEGVITDSAFIGVSTEYLVRTAWGQSVSVFAQNTHLDTRLVPGAPVELTWDSWNSFGLDATQSASAGSEIEGNVAAAVDAAPVTT
jgi:spermidine/putrescine transport system ATP-binding protein